MGDWNLSPWAYGGLNFSTTTVSSDGSTPVSLLATVNSTAFTSFLNGGLDGMASSANIYFVFPLATSTYQLTQNFFLNTAVNFEITSSQSQFFDTMTDNGVGIRIKSESAIDIIGYNLKISLAGGGVFSSVGGEYDGFGNLAGLGTNSITFEWNPFATIDGVASFDGIQISGGITGFSVMHDVTYFNNAPEVLDLTNVVELKINTTEVLPGDYNHNDTVDAADYVVWRNNFSDDQSRSTTALRTTSEPRSVPAAASACAHLRRTAVGSHPRAGKCIVAAVSGNRCRSQETKSRRDVSVHQLVAMETRQQSTHYEAVLISSCILIVARRPPFEEFSCADASDGNSSDYSRCLCFVVLRTVSFIQIRRAAHSFSRDSAASATSLCVKRADADLSHVTGQLGWEILLSMLVCAS